MSIRHVNKASKRIYATRSEYGEYSNSWHYKGGWCAYQKRMHSRALRVLARAVIEDELEQMDLCYVVQVPAGRKDPETKRRRKARWEAQWTFWQVHRLQQGLPPWAEDWETRLSPYRKARAAAYAEKCRERRTAYWRKHVA